MESQKPAELVEPERISDGFLLTVSPQNQHVGIAFLCFGLVWMGCSGVIFFNTLQEALGASDFNLFNYFLVAFVGIFLLVGISIVGLALLEVWANIKLLPAELILPKYPLRLGESCPVYYRRKLRNGTFAKEGTVEARLVCDEWVQYTQGTDTVTKTHELHGKAFPDATIVSGEPGADYDAEITIPADRPSSFYGNSNKIRWRFIVRLKVPGIPQVCKSTFHLKVLPEVITL